MHSNPPHSEKPLTLGLMFASKNAQHAFLDLAIDDSFKKTKIPTFVNKFGAVCLDEDNLKISFAASWEGRISRYAHTKYKSEFST